MSHSNRSIAYAAWGIASATLAFALCWTRGIAYLYERHPHEDAFILFRYVEHLAGGHGIVFNRMGPPAEGATDFLWMLMLALLVRLGVDVAVAAVWLNALGSALLAHVLFRLWTRGEAVTLDRGIFCLLLAACVPFLAGAHASYDGFSALLYSALIVLVYHAVTSQAPAAAVAVPYLSLGLGLFRPDGVIVGIGFCLVLLLLRIRDPGARKTLIVHGGIAFLGGVLYFLWRYRYFGELLPLPLYVKSQGVEGMIGAAHNKRWLWSGSGPVPLLLVLGLCAATLLRRRAVGFVRDLVGTVPLWMLFAALAFAHQSQNVDWRFQAPIYTIMLAAMVSVGARMIRSNPVMEVRLLVPLLCAAALLPALAEGKKIWPVDYMDVFAVRLGRVLDEQSMVLTEAGRMAYWTTATVHDMVGLNTAHTAKQPPTLAYIEGLEPDIVMFHAAGTLDFPRMVLLSGDRKQSHVLHIDPKSLRKAVKGVFRSVFEQDLTEYQVGQYSTKIAPVVLGRYLSLQDDFDVFAIRYGDTFNHLFGIRKGQPFTTRMEDEIRRSHEQEYISYAAAKGFPPGGLACEIGAAIASHTGNTLARHGDAQPCH